MKKRVAVIGGSGQGAVQQGSVWSRINFRGIMMASMPGFIAMALCLAISKILGLGGLEEVFNTLVGILPVVLAAIAAKQVSGLDEVGGLAGILAGLATGFVGMMVSAGITLANVIFPRQKGDASVALPGFLINVGFGTFVETSYPFMFSSKLVFGAALLSSGFGGALVGLFGVMGTDMIGMMTGMSYEGVAAGEIPAVLRERVQAMVEAVSVPTLAEGGINTTNFKAFHSTGVNNLVIGTAIDHMVERAARQAVAQFLK